MSSDRGTTCSAAMESFHLVLDGDLMDVAERERMQSHLAVCAECGERARQLRELQGLLRGMAESPMPEAAVREVRQRAIHGPHSRPSRGASAWRFAAAAAAVLLAVWTGVALYPEPPRDLAEADAERAAREVRVVLQLAARALQRTEQVTVREVFVEEISPALQKVGVTWPQAPGSGPADEG